MGLPKDLDLKGNEFTWAATSFSISYLIAEVPTGEEARGGGGPARDVV